MFAPVVKSVHLGAAAEAVAASAVAAVASALRRADAARVPRDRRPTCWRAEVAGGRRRAVRAPAPLPAARVRARRIERLERAPSARCSGSAAARATRRTRGRRAGREARRAGHHHLRRARACCRRATRCLVGLPPHVPRPPGAVGRGRRRARDRLGPRRRADAELRAAAAADADRGHRLEATRQELPRRTCSWPATRATWRARWPRGLRRARRADAGGPLAEARSAACAARRRRALRFLDAIRFARPRRRRRSSSTCASRATGSPGFHTPAAPRRLQVPLGWGTLGYAFPAALGAALAGARPGRLDLRRRRLPLRLRRARHDGPGAHPADRA